MAKHNAEAKHVETAPVATTVKATAAPAWHHEDKHDHHQTTTAPVGATNTLTTTAMSTGTTAGTSTTGGTTIATDSIDFGQLISATTRTLHNPNQTTPTLDSSSTKLLWQALKEVLHHLHESQESDDHDGGDDQASTTTTTSSGTTTGTATSSTTTTTGTTVTDPTVTPTTDPLQQQRLQEQVRPP